MHFIHDPLALVPRTHTPQGFAGSDPANCRAARETSARLAWGPARQQYPSAPTRTKACSSDSYNLDGTAAARGWGNPQRCFGAIRTLGAQAHVEASTKARR